MLTHWFILRRHVLNCLWFFLLSFCFCFYFSDGLLKVVLSPLIHTLPHTSQLVLTRVGASIFFSINLAAKIALFLTVPFGLLQIWRFVRPGLYQKECQMSWLFLLSSLGLFIAGALFCFYIILPCVFRFLVEYTPSHIHLMLDAADAMDLTFNMLIAFGLCFQLPLVCVLLVKMDWVSLLQLKQARRYMIVIVFIVGMLLAPPDVLSQTMIALPLYCLFEMGIWCAKMLTIKKHH